MELILLWFVLWGIFWAGYFTLDGFDFGVGMIYNFLAGSDGEKRLALNSVGPIWNGNEVWILGAGSASWAIFPNLYATLLSSMYLPIFLIIVGYVLRGIAFEYRNKIDSVKWRSGLDKAMFVGNLLPALLFGVAFGNLFMGMPIGADGFEGNFFSLLSPYSLLTGLLFVLLFLAHGSLWLNLKVGGELKAKAQDLAVQLLPIAVAVLAVFAVASYVMTDLLNNYVTAPVLLIVPLIAVVSLILARQLALAGDHVRAFGASCAAICSVVFTGVIGLFPNLIKSSIDPVYSINIMNSASSGYAIMVVSVFAAIFVPAFIVYQVWVYQQFTGVMTVEQVMSDEEAY